MTIAILCLILFGYVLIAYEHLTHINKATIALFAAVVGWILFMCTGTDFVLKSHGPEFMDFTQGGAFDAETTKEFIASHVFIPPTPGPVAAAGMVGLENDLLLVIGLYFIFRYLIYLVKGLFRVFRLRSIIEKRGDSAVPLKESDVNLSLSNTLITLTGWLLYLILAFSILHVPTTTLTAISAGLAAGVGFALKDLINNFFYGIQLMAGRIRVGDKISCDGVRGIVKRLSYQTTQVEDEDGSLIAFTNTELFTKKFRNLNTGRNYEFLKIPVSVKYGTDIAFARKVILEALEPLMTKDQTGRDIVDPTFPVDVRFDSFGDSSVNLIVALYSTVETHYTFPSRAKEAIYNAFYENGIEIPFPQRDLYVKSVPKD